MSEYVRVCRDCGEEYRAGVDRCADCGGELQDRQLDEDGKPIAADAEPVPEGPAVAVERRELFVTPQARELVPLADALREAGIEYHLVERPATSSSAPRYALLVEEADEGAARRALAPLSEEPRPEPGAAGDAPEVPGDGASCPACGAEQPAGAVECGECGLVFGAEAENAATCARCGGPLPNPGASCPLCPPD